MSDTVKEVQHNQLENQLLQYLKHKYPDSDIRNLTVTGEKVQVIYGNLVGLLNQKQLAEALQEIKDKIL